MASQYGQTIRFSVFGQSHSGAIGIVMDGLPPGEEISEEAIYAHMKRRLPGQNAYSTKRKEADIPEIVSGLYMGKTCGAPLCAVIRNTDTRSGDYEELKRKPRPSHADFPAFVKYAGANDIRGGGHFSGRLTAPLCFAGAVCEQILSRRGITVGVHIESIGGVTEMRFDPVHVNATELLSLKEKDFPVLNDRLGEKMIARIEEARAASDSVGGVVECAAVGLPQGLGEPMFDGIENRIAAAVFGIPAVKGIEFGIGFASSDITGSENNDPYYYDENGAVRTTTNNCGGVAGGITNGMPLIFRAALKPTPSIFRPQKTVDLLDHENTDLIVQGRHDPCIVPRAAVCIESVAATVLLDLLKEAGRL